MPCLQSNYRYPSIRYPTTRRCTAPRVLAYPLLHPWVCSRVRADLGDHAPTTNPRPQVGSANKPASIETTSRMPASHLLYGTPPTHPPTGTVEAQAVLRPTMAPPCSLVRYMCASGRFAGAVRGRFTSRNPTHNPSIPVPVPTCWL